MKAWPDKNPLFPLSSILQLYDVPAENTRTTFQLLLDNASKLDCVQAPGVTTLIRNTQDNRDKIEILLAGGHLEVHAKVRPQLKKLFDA
jgi:hypothetical protein